MSVLQASVAPERGASPLMSNNPFRNKIGSRVSPEPSRPISTNPFLDASEVNAMATETNQAAVVRTNSVDKTVHDLATLNVNGEENQLHQTRSRQTTSGPRKPDPSSTRGFLRPPGHQPANSEEETRPQHPRQESDIFADTFALKDPNRQPRKTRRNSESSVRDKPTMDAEEERRRRERKYRETKRSGSKSTKPSKKLDIIDKLDVTSIYGTGLFHHDGPFDACNPHRNRKREKYAPMQAFPKDSINMVMGGSGPVNKRMDYDRFHGRGDEAHIDYNEAAVVDDRVESYQKEAKADQFGYNPVALDTVHGRETTGLGTSTFLEGAPASRVAIQRRESEYETQQSDERPGLSRKKSLAQKIRGVRPSRDRFASPEGRNGGALSPPITGPMTGQSDNTAGNPFFKDYDSNAKDKRDAPLISFEERPKTGRARAPSSPMRGMNILERRNTVESAGEDGQSKPSGLLGRMKSLKGGRRPVRRETNN